jgi:hypothetical protein
MIWCRWFYFMALALFGLKSEKSFGFLALGPGFVVLESRAGPRPRGFTGQSLTSTIK